MHDSSTVLAGKVFLVTGANTGIGEVTARRLAERGARVVCACRSATSGSQVVEEMRRSTGNDGVELLVLDLGSLASVRRAADQFSSRGLPLDVLVNNAGVAGQRGSTADGFELAFGINHLGHFLLTQLLLDRLLESPAARIVTVSSHSHHRARRIDYDRVRSPTRSLSGLPEYEVSKLANVLFSAELARRLRARGVSHVRTYSLHPGTVATDVWRRIPDAFAWVMKRFMLTVEEGARTTLHCATSDDVATESGRYYAKCKPRTPSGAAQDQAMAEELWAKSEELVRSFA